LNTSVIQNEAKQITKAGTRVKKKMDEEIFNILRKDGPITVAAQFKA
jgi:hypothetical protein